MRLFKLNGGKMLKHTGTIQIESERLILLLNTLITYFIIC